MSESNTQLHESSSEIWDLTARVQRVAEEAAQHFTQRAGVEDGKFAWLEARTTRAITEGGHPISSKSCVNYFGERVAPDMGIRPGTIEVSATWALRTSGLELPRNLYAALDSGKRTLTVRTLGCMSSQHSTDLVSEVVWPEADGFQPQYCRETLLDLSAGRIVVVDSGALEGIDQVPNNELETTVQGEVPWDVKRHRIAGAAWILGAAEYMLRGAVTGSGSDEDPVKGTLYLGV